MRLWFGVTIIEHTFTVERYTGGNCVLNVRIDFQIFIFQFFLLNSAFRFDEDIKHVELDYPRDMSIWRGIGYHIDAAFQWKNGKLNYFFYELSNECHLKIANFQQKFQEKHTSSRGKDSGNSKIQ